MNKKKMSLRVLNLVKQIIFAAKKLEKGYGRCGVEDNLVGRREH
jgi:hypothetical protein